MMPGDDGSPKKSKALRPSVSRKGLITGSMESGTSGGGTIFSLRHPGGKIEITSPLLGGYNVLNVAGAAALALATGAEPEAVADAARRMPQVPGRFERVAGAEQFEVIVDYAHTDVGLSAVLAVAREVARGNELGGRVICVFGAAGDRDGAKRPLMGRAAAELADWSIVTTDDAYSEDPAKIAREVAAGADPERTEVLLDRREAIRRALSGAKPGDVVLVAGKGPRAGAASSGWRCSVPRRRRSPGAFRRTRAERGLRCRKRTRPRL